MEKVRATQRRMERPIIGLRWDDKVMNSQVRMVTQMEDVGYKTKKLKVKFAGVWPGKWDKSGIKKF